MLSGWQTSDCVLKLERTIVAIPNGSNANNSFKIQRMRLAKWFFLRNALLPALQTTRIENNTPVAVAIVLLLLNRCSAAELTLLLAVFLASLDQN